MKNLFRLFTILSLLVIICACKKERVSSPDTDYMFYDGSQGVIGKMGGRIRINDINSPLNGANIIVPAGALKDNTSLSLEMDNSIRSNLDTLANILKLEPDGLIFNKPVELKMVRKDLANPRVYYFLPDSDSVEQIHITLLDAIDGFVTVNLNHFSRYLTTDLDNGTIEGEIFKTSSSMKAGIQFGGILNEKLTLSKIPVVRRTDNMPSDITNALEAICSGESSIDPNSLHARIKVSLMEGNLQNLTTLKTLGFDVFRTGSDINNFKVKVVQNEPAGGKVFNSKILDPQTLEDFFSGKALVFNFGINPLPGKEYYLSVSWVLYGYAAGDKRITCKFDISSWNEHLPWRVGSNMSSDDPDFNNNFISDYYDMFAAD